MKKIICQNCKAEFDENETKCPYCGFLYAEGMEKKYLDDLEEKRLELDVVDDKAREEYKEDAKKNGKKVIKIVLIVSAIMLVLVGYWHIDENRTWHNKYTAEEEIVWQQETFPVLDELYEKGDYDSCWDILLAEENADHQTWEWQYYEALHEKLDAELEAITP